MSKGIGIIGCGRIAQVRHIPELSANDRCHIVGYFNPTRSRAESMATVYGGKVYDSVEGMLEDTDVEGVVVCLANSAHAEVSVKALLAGKDVLCEKPMATSLGECERMMEAARRSRRLLLIAQNQRLSPAHTLAKELIEGGAIGRVLSFRTTFGHSGPENCSISPGKDTWFFRKDTAVMGVMADLGVHKTDLIQYLLGCNVVGVSSSLCTLDKTGPDGAAVKVDDNAICIFRMESGAVGTMTSSWTYYGWEDNSTIIYGTEGQLRIYDCLESPLRLVYRDGSFKDFHTPSIQTNSSQSSSGMADYFVEALYSRDGGILSAERVLPAMRAVFAAIESSQRGAYIPIPENYRR